MGTNKKYTSINRQSLLIVIALPQKKGQCTIEFKTGYGLSAEGYYFTNDPIIQEALESDKRFNKSFRLDKIDNVSIHEYNAKITVDKQNEDDELPVIIEKVFSNVNGAKDFFKADPYEIPVSKLATKSAIIDQGKALNFDIKFETDK